MNTKPLIGINADYRTAVDNKPPFTFVASGYYDALIKCGALPIILPPLTDDDDLSRVLDMLDGFLMVGGGDLDPRNDGFMLHPTVRPLDVRRETFDRRLIDMIAHRRMPLFGIGVGIQLLNVSQGGNLFLHIPEDMPTALPHKDPMDPSHRHGLEIQMGTLMERVYGDGEIRVNSFHHMSVDEVAPGFDVTARSPDGVIEAIESTQENWFAFGTQFHPEGNSATALDLRVFEEFIVGVTSNMSATV